MCLEARWTVKNSPDSPQQTHQSSVCEGRGTETSHFMQQTVMNAGETLMTCRGTEGSWHVWSTLETDQLCDVTAKEMATLKIENACGVHYSCSHGSKHNNTLALLEVRAPQQRL